MNSETMTDEQRKDLLRSLNLSPDAPGLALSPALDGGSPARPADLDEDALRRSTPAAEIVFDPTMLDGFPNLDGGHMAAASRYLFEMYKSPHKDKERHALLHRRIGEFIRSVRIARKTGDEPVTEKIKATKEQREIAALMATHGLTANDLAQIIKERE